MSSLRTGRVGGLHFHWRIGDVDRVDVGRGGDRGRAVAGRINGVGPFVVAAAGLPRLVDADLGRHVVVDADEKRPEMTFLLLTNFGKDELEVGLAEGGRVLLDCVHKGAVDDLAAACVRGWSYLQHRTGVVAGDLDLGALVRLSVASTNDLENGNANPSLLGHQIPDRIRLEEGGPLVAAGGVEGTELNSDGLGDLDRVELDVVTHRSIRPWPGGIRDVLNGDVPPHELLEHRSDVLLRPLLPLLGGLAKYFGTAGDHDEGLVADIYVEIMNFGIDCSTKLDFFAESTVVLFQDHDSVLEHAGGLVGLGDPLVARLGQIL